MFKRKKLTKEEKKKFKELKKKNKLSNKINKKIKTTLNWCDVKEIHDDYVLLNGNYYVKGIKLSPINIHLFSKETSVSFFNNFRSILNKIKLPLYFCFVKTPVDISSATSNIYNLGKKEDNNLILNLLNNDLEKYEMFKELTNELEFHIYIRSNDLKDLNDNFNLVYNDFASIGFYIKKLVKKDFLNYFNFLFENPLINDYYFTRGIFSYTGTFKRKNAYHLLQAYSYSKDEFEDIEVFSNKENYKINLKSKLVPTGYTISKNHLTIGNKYVVNLLVLELPFEYYPGILADFINIPNVKCSMLIEPFDYSLDSIIKKQYNDKLREYNKTVDPTLRTNLEMELNGLDVFLKRLLANQDITYNTIITFSCYGDTLQEANELAINFEKKLSSRKIKLIKMIAAQDQIFIITCPFLLECTLHKIIRNNWGLPLSSESIVGLHPFIFETLKDNQGFLFGYELYNNGIISFDPFYYINQKEDSKSDKRINGNMVIVGKSGSGKTTAIYLMIRHFIREKTKIFWIDPENKNAHLTYKFNGNFIEFGTRNSLINPFDLKVISVDDDNKTEEEIERIKYDTELAIASTTDKVCQIMQMLFKEFDDQEAAIMGYAIKLAYRNCGFINKDGTYNSFKNAKYTDYPIFSDVKKIIIKLLDIFKDDRTKEIEVLALNKINVKLERLINEWAIYFNGHTTVFNENDNYNLLSFGTKTLFTLSENLKNALNYIIFTSAWGECIKSNDLAALIIDEAHTSILQKHTALMVEQFARRARKYNTILLLGTQEPRDFSGQEVINQGKAIFNNSTYKMIMALDKEPINDLEKLVNINDNEKEVISSFQQGEALLFCGDKKIPFQVLVTNEEKNDMGID